MKKILLFGFVFGLLFLGGTGIFIAGMVMNIANVGIDSKFYLFFDNNIWGWILMFGSILIGLVGIIVLVIVVKCMGISDGDYYSSYNHNDSDNSYKSGYDYDDYSSSSTYTESDYSSFVGNSSYYDADGHSIGYSVGDRYYNNEGSCVGYDIGDRHYDTNGSSTGYRVGDREYDSDGHSVGYWIGDTFYKT